MPQMRFDINGIMIKSETDRITREIGKVYPLAKLDFSGPRAGRLTVTVTNPDGEFEDVQRRLGQILSGCAYPNSKILPAVVAIKGKAPIV